MPSRPEALLPTFDYSFVRASGDAVGSTLLCVSLMAPESSVTERRGLSVCFVIDSSGSMFFSLMSKKEISRWAQIARSRGELASVVSDGKDMTTVVGRTKREMIEADVTPMDFVVKAIEQAVEKLGTEDEVGVVAFGDKGSLLIDGPVGDVALGPLGQLADRRFIKELGNGTHLAAGLGPCLDWLGERRYDEGRKKVVLFSDGLVDDEKRAMLSVRRLMQTGAAISTFGLGADFDEDMLAEIADKANGDYHFMEQPDQVAQALEQEMLVERAIVTGDIHMSIRPAGGLTLGDVYQALPVVKLVDPLRRTLVDRTYNVGAMSAGEERILLVQLHGRIDDLQEPAGEIEILPASTEADGGDAASESHTATADADRFHDADSDARAAQLARRVEAYTIQREARRAADTGDRKGAAAKMEDLSAVLDNLGESELAGAAKAEAASLRGETGADQGRTKKLKAATRKITRSRRV